MHKCIGLQLLRSDRKRQYDWHYPRFAAVSFSVYSQLGEVSFGPQPWRHATPTSLLLTEHFFASRCYTTCWPPRRSLQNKARHNRRAFDKRNTELNQRRAIGFYMLCQKSDIPVTSFNFRDITQRKVFKRLTSLAYKHYNSQPNKRTERTSI